MKNFKLQLELIEAPKGVFTAQIKEVRGAVVQEYDKHKAIEEVFKQAWIAINLDSANFKG
jgi:hypothetical protein